MVEYVIVFTQNCSKPESKILLSSMNAWSRWMQAAAVKAWFTIYRQRSITTGSHTFFNGLLCWRWCWNRKNL